MNFGEVTYKQIEDANRTIKTTPIRGKDYAEVNQRIKAFRMVYPAGFIKTKIESVENGMCIMTATVGYQDLEGVEFIIGHGTAYEKENSSNVNRTSYIENCETSAVGRALGMAGFGIDTSVASYEEVETAIANQEIVQAIPPKPTKEELIDKVVAMCDVKHMSVTELCRQVHVQDLNELSEDRLIKAINYVKGL